MMGIDLYLPTYIMIAHRFLHLNSVIGTLINKKEKEVSSREKL